LAAALGRVVGDFERHLTVERGLSAHTVRAYVGDVVSLLEHLSEVAGGGAGLERLDLAVMRSWLAALLAGAAMADRFA